MKKAIASNDDDGDKYNDDDHDSNDGRDNNSNQEKWDPSIAGQTSSLQAPWWVVSCTNLKIMSPVYLVYINTYCRSLDKQHIMCSITIGGFTV